MLAPASVDAASGARVHLVELVLRPRSGFDAHDVPDEAIDPEARRARLTITADGRALPLVFEAPAAGFTLEVRLTEACGGFGCVRPALAGG
jgi:hypothetical protein